MEETSKDKKLKKSIITLSIVSGVFIVLAVFLALISLNQRVSEFLTKYWAQPFSKMMGTITSVFGFSIFEWGCFFGVLAIIITIILIFVKCKGKKKLQVFMQIVTSIVCVICIYVSVATVSYNRAPIPIPMMQNESINEDIVKTSYIKYMEEFEGVASRIQKDEEGGSISPYNKDELARKIESEYAKYNNDYFGNYSAKTKFITFSSIMSDFNILGITFVPFGEANVNGIAPMTDIAQTIAHELSHTRGIMREGDANLMAFYILLNSNDDYLKYCGYLATVRWMNYAVKYSNAPELIKDIPDVAKIDYERERAFWDRHDSLAAIGEFFNNIYLKLQGQTGTNSYYQPMQGKYDEKTGLYYDVIYTNIQRMILQKYA